MLDRLRRAAYLLEHDINIGHENSLEAGKAGPHEKFERAVEIA